MASKTVVELVDDLDGGRAEETVRFALDGTEYEIDLSAKNAAKLRAALATFVGHAKKQAAEPRAVADTKATTEATATVTPGPAHEPRPRPARRTPEPRPAPVHNRAATKAAAQSLAAEPARPEPVQQKPAEPKKAEPKPEPKPQQEKKTPSGPAAALFVPFSETN